MPKNRKEKNNNYYFIIIIFPFGKTRKNDSKNNFFLVFLKNTQNNFSGFLRFPEEHTKFFCAIRTYKPFLYVLIVNSPCTIFCLIGNDEKWPNRKLWNIFRLIVNNDLSKQFPKNSVPKSFFLFRLIGN